jgi:hypothetical protein
MSVIETIVVYGALAVATASLVSLCVRWGASDPTCFQGALGCDTSRMPRCRCTRYAQVGDHGGGVARVVHDVPRPHR